MELSNEELIELWNSLEKFIALKSKKWEYQHRDDFIQEAFINIVEQLKKCNNQKDIKKYAMQAIRFAGNTTSISVIDKRVRNANKSSNEIYRNKKDLTIDMAKTKKSRYTTDIVQDKEQVELIYKAIEKLNEYDKKLIKWLLGEKKQIRLSEELGISKQLLNQHIFYARRKLSKILEKEKKDEK